MMTLQMMFGPTFLRADVNKLGEGGVLNRFLTIQADNPPNLAFKEIIVKGCGPYLPT